MTAEEMLDITVESEKLRQKCDELVREVDTLTSLLKQSREKLREAQERCRKLDWLLVAAVEGK